MGLRNGFDAFEIYPLIHHGKTLTAAIWPDRFNRAFLPLDVRNFPAPLERQPETRRNAVFFDCQFCNRPMPRIYSAHLFSIAMTVMGIICPGFGGNLIAVNTPDHPERHADDKNGGKKLKI